MTPRRALVLLAALAVASGSAAAAAVAFPPPILSASTLTIPARDSTALVVAWVRRCAVGNLCPTAFALTVTRRGVVGISPEAARAVTRFRDTVRVERAVCPVAGVATVDTMHISVRALSAGGIDASPPARTRLVVRCSPATTAERARADSFPAPAILFADTAGVIEQHGTTSVPAGYVATMCLVARHRITGAVVLLDGDPAACEAARQRWAAR